MPQISQNIKRQPNWRTLVVSISSILTALSLALLLFGNYTQGVEDSADKKSLVNRLLVVTVNGNSADEAFKRFNRSVSANELNLIVLDPRGPPSTSDREKYNQMKKALVVYKNEPDLVLLVVDSRNLVLNGNERDILNRFNKFRHSTRVVFSAATTCWPDEKLADQFPTPVGGGERFISSTAYIGFATSLWDLFAEKDDVEALQPYFTSSYLNQELRQRIGIEIDHKAELFQNLNKAESDVDLEFKEDSVSLKNIAHLTEPVVVHGDETEKVSLNSLGNYLGKAWTVKDGCKPCNESATSLDTTKNEDLPVVLIAAFIEEPTPFLEDFFTNIYKLNYPRNKIHLFVHNAIEYHEKQVDKFLVKFGSQYASQFLIGPKDNSGAEWEARTRGLKKCLKLNCDYYLALDSIARLENTNSLRALIESNKTIVAPMLSRPGKLWSNFWGAVTTDGYYARSHDYIELVKRNRIGIWNVPHIMNAYLIEGKFLRRHLESELENSAKVLSYHDPDTNSKPVLTFSRQLRAAEPAVFQYLSNQHEFGHLVDPTTYNISRTNPDFYQLSENMEDWEEHYLHDNYSRIVDDDEVKLEQPCQDVFWFPLVNERFCTELIEIMEAYGKWSGGTNDDPRIEGGYESVPTRDIHFKQVGLHDMWLIFLREYVMPVQLKEYIGYEHDPPRTDLAFVVRYHPAEQASLRPHHDSSTYTLNIALNSPHVDYEGGGCRFVRYNCSVVDSRLGWALIHPGRLTHYHEGLPVKSGTRYIMVTFVDP